MNIFILLSLMLCASFVKAVGTQQDQTISTEQTEKAKQDGIQKVEEANTKTQNVFFDDRYKNIKDPEKGKQQKESLKVILSQYVNTDLVARTVLPRSLWKKMTPNQKKEYKEIFKNEIVNTYYSMLNAEYRKRVDHAIDPTKTKAIPRKKGSFLIRVESTFKSTPPVHLSWTLLKGKIIDLRVEGASLVRAKKTDYKSLMRQCMLDGKVDVDIFLSKIKKT